MSPCLAIAFLTWDEFVATKIAIIYQLATLTKYGIHTINGDRVGRRYDSHKRVHLLRRRTCYVTGRRGHCVPGQILLFITCNWLGVWLNIVNVDNVVNHEFNQSLDIPFFFGTYLVLLSPVALPYEARHTMNYPKNRERFAA